MGFFDKIFGGNATANLPETKVRAAYKDTSFFKKMVDKKRSAIKMYQEDNLLLKQPGKFRPVNNWMIAMEYLDLIYLHYSIGDNITKCYDEYLQAAAYYGQGWDPDAFYSDMIDMIALGSLLNVPDDVYEPVINYIPQSDKGSSYGTWTPDALLWHIINSRKPESGPQPDTLISEAYRDVYDLTKMPKADAAREMKLYLDIWYRLHKDTPWYNAHTKESAYRGYWCWEAGAVTKIMGLDDSSYKDNPCYPYDMVHWNG
jgi:hypothetical protein